METWVETFFAWYIIWYIIWVFYTYTYFLYGQLKRILNNVSLFEYWFIASNQSLSNSIVLGDSGTFGERNPKKRGWRGWVQAPNPFGGNYKLRHQPCLMSVNFAANFCNFLTALKVNPRPFSVRQSPFRLLSNWSILIFSSSGRLLSDLINPARNLRIWGICSWTSLHASILILDEPQVKLRLYVISMVFTINNLIWTISRLSTKLQPYGWWTVLSN